MSEIIYLYQSCLFFSEITEIRMYNRLLNFCIRSYILSITLFSNFCIKLIIMTMMMITYTSIVHFQTSVYPQSLSETQIIWNTYCNNNARKNTITVHRSRQSPAAKHIWCSRAQHWEYGAGLRALQNG